MAKETPTSHRNLVFYEVYLRNHTQQGTFRAFESDLERIKNMGVDFIWFMPVHPIGKLNKKGRLGCPYSISDYRKVNPEYGSLDDFIHLVQAIHSLGMRVMIDVVYNHTAHDSVLVQDHPEFFHQDPTGNPITTVPEWSDVIDLKHPNTELTRYLIDCLIYWIKLGVDGFRCDVASLVPLEFWLQARRAVAEVNPAAVWLAESVHAGFIECRHQMGLSSVSDSELYKAFDITYDYDIWPIFQAAVSGKSFDSRFLEMVRLQHTLYPANYVKLHFVENHDQARIMSFAASREAALAWTAFQVFNQGAFLIYGGQEMAVPHTPSLFAKDPVQWQGDSIQPFLTSLCQMKKMPILADGSFTIHQSKPVVQAVYSDGKSSLLGVFNTRKYSGGISVPLTDGKYRDILNNIDGQISQGKITVPQIASILEIPYPLTVQPFFSELLDTDIKPV
jgi:glycosidase